MYYVTKKTLLSMFVFLGLSAAIGIPTTLNVLSTEPTNLKAEEVEVVESSEEVNEDLESYSEA
ncbi:MAG: hypothetical protein K5906_02550 [Bacilli bacterium]|nr:hypothetical protein [Bacilli bacterium]